MFETTTNVLHCTDVKGRKSHWNPSFHVAKLMSDSLVLCFPPPLSLTFASLEALGLTIEFPVCLASKIFPIEYTNGIKSTYQHIRYLAMLLHGESYQLAIFLYIFEKKNCFKLLILIFIFIFMHGFVGKLWLLHAWLLRSTKMIFCNTNCSDLL